MAEIETTGRINPPDLPEMVFAPKDDLKFDYGPNLPGHANGMILMAIDEQGDVILQETYYSIGGGFVLTADELEHGADKDEGAPVPYPFKSAAEMLEMAAKSGKTIAEMKKANELTRRSHAEVDRGLDALWQVMDGCINRGLANEGILPGGLNVRRRAAGIYNALMAERGMNLTAPHTINDWMSTYAMAVNEENAAGGQVVTAPTNGAAGVLPRDHTVLAGPRARRDAHAHPRVPTDRGCNWRLGEIQRQHQRSRSWLSGRGWQRKRHGGCGAVRRDGRHDRANRKRGRNRAGAPPRDDLRSGQRLGAGALH